MTESGSNLSDFAPRILTPTGQHPILLVCEHASPRMPNELNALGLSDAERISHIAWDPGALAVAQHMSAQLDAALVISSASRLLYDCNRPPEAPDAIPERSETTVVPGNQNLSPSEKNARVAVYYRPFEALLSKALDSRGDNTVMVTLHSFTPTYFGKPRAVEIGILHDTDARLADAVLEVATGFTIKRNEPYGPEDGVTHTLRRHALPRGLMNVMIEIRNDLIQTPEQCGAMASTLTDWVTQALARIGAPAETVK